MTKEQKELINKLRVKIRKMKQSSLLEHYDFTQLLNILDKLEK